MRRNRLLLLLLLLLTAATGAWAQSTTTHKVTMKSGTKDAANWTISDGTTTDAGAPAPRGAAAVCAGTAPGQCKIM